MAGNRHTYIFRSDYEDVGVLDAYEVDAAAEGEDEGISASARAAAEAALRKRDREEGRRAGGRRLGAALVSDDEEEGELGPVQARVTMGFSPVLDLTAEETETGTGPRQRRRRLEGAAIGEQVAPEVRVVRFRLQIQCTLRICADR
jgi:hypothetical protein